MDTGFGWWYNYQERAHLELLRSLHVPAFDFETDEGWIDRVEHIVRWNFGFTSRGLDGNRIRQTFRYMLIVAPRGGQSEAGACHGSRFFRELVEVMANKCR